MLRQPRGCVRWPAGGVDGPRVSGRTVRSVRRPGGLLRRRGPVGEGVGFGSAMRVQRASDR